MLQVTHRVALSHHSPPAVGIRYQASAVRILLHTAVAEQPQNNRESCRRKPVGLLWTQNHESSTAVEQVKHANEGHH